MGYLPQFGAPPKDIRRVEVWAALRMLALPTNALTIGLLNNFGSFGLPAVRPVANITVAVAVRFALKYEETPRRSSSLPSLTCSSSALKRWQPQLASPLAIWEPRTGPRSRLRPSSGGHFTVKKVSVGAWEFHFLLGL